MSLMSADEHLKVNEIGRRVGCQGQAVRMAIHAFHKKGVACLAAGSHVRHGDQRAFDEAAREQLCVFIQQSPREFEYETSLWTLDLLARASFEQGLSTSGYIRDKSQASRSILVVDECDYDTFVALRQRILLCDNKLLLFSIGTEAENYWMETEDIMYLQLEALNDNDIQQIVCHTNNHLGYDLEVYIADVVDGNVKLATAIAESLGKKSAITLDELLRERNLNSLITSLVENDDERKPQTGETQRG